MRTRWTCCRSSTSDARVVRGRPRGRGAAAGGHPPGTCINYHRRLLRGNTTLASAWRTDPPAPLAVTQPDGPSWRVTGRHVAWQGWTLRVGFNAREGLVLHDVRHGGRRVVDRASLVEMAVPYGDPQGPYPRKCAFDVGDYGLGACANSLSLGCDCLGAIHYFGATLSDAGGSPSRSPALFVSTRKMRALGGSTPTTAAARPRRGAGGG
eukprot:TRINITY_DN972_c0_g1_i1.p3 TRINITY_DN972_c0_g1~~TRINITY_DN972_c0_g1_i1.p3  ORF type:complete len:209 (-),score=33.71 TRINITY_DN972_c0_g1_i1:697-1323(-)